MNFPKTTLLLYLAAASGTALAQTKAYVQSAEYYVGIASNTPQCPVIRYLFRGVSREPDRLCVVRRCQWDEQGNRNHGPCLRAVSPHPDILGWPRSAW